MDRIYLDKDNLLVFIYDHIRPFGKTIRRPEEAVLLCNSPVRPEIAEQLSLCYAEIFRPCFFTGYGIDTDTYGSRIEGRESIQVVLEGLHLGGTERGPCKGVKGKKRPLTHIFKEIKRLVILVFQ